MMPSKTQMHDAGHQDTTVMGYSPEVKRSLLLQTPRLAKEKILSPRASRGLKPRERDKVLKCNQQMVVAQDNGARRSFPSKSSGYFPQEKWPNRRGTRVEELVKHMSSVPGYLQHIERGDNVQEKALNFGVLDWRHLEKWTGNHKQVVVNERAVHSLARGSTSSPFSEFGSSSPSCRSNGNSSLATGDRSSSLDCQKNLVVEEDHRQMTEEETCRQNVGFPYSEMTPRESLIRHQRPPKTDRHLRMDLLECKLEKSQRKGLDSRAVSNKVWQSPETRIWPSATKGIGNSNSINHKMKAPDTGSNYGEGKFQESDNKCSGSSLFERNCSDDHSQGLSHSIDGVSDHHGSHRFSFDSMESGNISPTDPSRKSHVGNFSSDDFQIAALSSAVPYSCPLPSYTESSEWLDVNAFASQPGQCSKVPCDASNSTLHLEAATIMSKGGNEKNNGSTTPPAQLFAAITPDRWGRHGAKMSTTTRRELFPNHQSGAGLNGMNRSSSLREGSATRQLKWTTCSDTPNEDKATDTSRARRSPLRRLLDPLLKPKAFSRTHPTEAPAVSPVRPSSELKYAGKPAIHEEFASIHGPHVFSNGSPKCTGLDEKNCTPSCRAPTESWGSHQDEKHRTATRQALLQLAWKNGKPLFTFSMNESDILAATRKRCISEKGGSECIYTFFHVHEVKKKSAGWIYQGFKNKKQGLISNVVGQMNVSWLQCPKLTLNDYRTHSAVREFVLSGAELRLTGHEVLDPLQKSELAAIVIRAPEENAESSAGDFPCRNKWRDPLKSEPEKNSSHQSVAYPESGNLERDVPNMVAILPSEIHGFSDTGKPSPLIERWKSGGSCDCGGWDMGCSLTVLTSNHHGSRRSNVAQSCCATDGTHRVELFNQASRENRTSFSLVAFREGLYTVDFHASVAPLQAFAVCVAVLHGRKLKLTSFLRPVDSAQTKYAPYHPPLSPVGRA